MYTVKVDPHTHTLFSTHAFSTIGENAALASQKGLEGIGMSDHFGEKFLPADSNGKLIFPGALNMGALPKQIEGVRVLAGGEIDIIDKEGRLFGWNNLLFEGHLKGKTLLDALLESRDVAIASYHGFIEEGEPLTKGEGTRMYAAVLQTPGVHILGHIGRPQIPFDVEVIAKEAKKTGKMIEINNHSYRFEKEIQERCKNIALACKQEGTYIAVSSDAHSAYQVGDFSLVFAMLKEIDFPQELIANESLEKFMHIIDQANQKQGFVTL